MNILALTGSLRRRSINTELLRSLVVLAPAHVVFRFSNAIGLLPHFNPDLDEDGSVPPTSVAALRYEIGAADALLISCPEYAHGVAGAFKNLLDWLVSSSEMPGKPVLVLNASAGAHFGPASLVETLKTMSAHVIGGAALTVPVDGRRWDADQIAADPGLSAVLRTALRLLMNATSDKRT